MKAADNLSRKKIKLFDKDATVSGAFEKKYRADVRDTGIIVKGVGGSYEVLLKDGSRVVAVPRGLFRKNKNKPYVGDRVDIVYTGEKGEENAEIEAVIDKIHQRETLLERPPASNADTLLFVLASINPLPDYKLLDSMLAYALDQGLKPLIALNKADYTLENQKARENLLYVKRAYGKAGFKVFAISSLSDNRDFEADLEKLRSEIKDAKVILAGQSGAGKSSLVNKLAGREIMQAGELSAKSKKGKHTTRHVEVIPMGEFYLYDTPGFFNLSLIDLGMASEKLPLNYPEFNNNLYACKFSNCKHMGDLGCRFSAEDFTEEIDAGRLQRYRELRAAIERAEESTYRQ